MALPEISVRVTADTAQAEAGLQRVDRAVKSTSTGTATAARQASGLSGAFQRMGNVSGSTRARIQQASFQIQDLAVQLQSGTRASVALSQQLPQLAGAFGAAGAALGVGLALGIPAVTMAMEAMRGKSVDLEEQIDNLTEAVSTYKEFADLASQSTDDLAKRFGSAATQAGAVAAYLSEWSRIEAVEELDTSLAALTETFGGLSREQLVAMDTTRGFFASLFDKDPVGLVREIDNTFYTLREELGLTDEQARAVVLSLERLANAEGVDAQIVAARQLSEEFVAVFGSVENIPPELREIAKQAGLIALQTAELKGGMEEVEGAVASIVLGVSNIAPALDPAIVKAYEFAGAMRSAAAAQMQAQQDIQTAAIANQYAQYGQGRAAFNNSVQGGLGLVGGGGGAAAGGGGGGGGNAALESLIESLQTQREVIDTWYQESLALLQNANAQELEVLGGHNEAKLRLEEEYQRRLSEIQNGYSGDSLTQAKTFFGEMADAMQSGNEKMLRIAKVFSAAQALINSYQAYTEVLKDPELPWFARIPAAVGILSAGMGMVNAIKGVGQGGSATASPAAANANAAPQMTQVANIVLNGDSFSQQSVKGLFDQLNEGFDNGLRLRVVTG